MAWLKYRRLENNGAGAWRQNKRILFKGSVKVMKEMALGSEWYGIMMK